MSVRKASLQEFQHQIKDVRSQLVDQIKCLEQRTEVQVSILHEVNDFLKKRAEIDLEYSKQLDKLVKSVMLKHKNEKQKRFTWSLYSTCSLWQQLVDDTKEEAKQRGITAEVYGNNIISSVSTRCTALQKISKKCREIGVLAQGEVIRVIDELFAAMKTYQLCFAEYNVMNGKLQQAEVEKSKTQESNSARKQRSVQKNFDKKSAKFEASRLKCNRARNEYLLSIEAANASLHKFFADDLSDLIDCTDLGMEYWLNLILTNIISARKAACQTEMNSLANLSTFKESLQPQLDKQKFFESNSSVFMLPKRFEFKCDSSEQINTIALDEGLSEELKQRHYQMCKRLERLRLESDESWQTLEQTEQRIRDLLSAATLVEITEHGIADSRPPEDTVEAELSKAYEFYLPNFRFYLLNANLIVRLEARADGIGNALIKANYPLNGGINENGGDDGCGAAQSTTNHHDEVVGAASDLEWHEQARRKKRLGSQASAATAESTGSNSGAQLTSGTQFSPLRRRRPRLFGGSLEEYVELTGEKIPLIVTSCIRVLSQFALHHQGVFRISGSQVEINHMKEAFENGEDPLCDVQNANDVNSIAGVLKLYLRELREPLFPFYLFELLTNCAQIKDTMDFINKISSLLCKLPRSNYLLLRYLFAFLNHLSEFSDENMMDHYNLAICFGPTLLPIPEGKDQVCYQASVNDLVRNLIVHHDLIFTARVAGPRYEKYDTTNGKNINDIDMYMDDEYFGSTTPAGTNTSSNTTAGLSVDGDDNAVTTLNSAEFFDFRNYASEMLKGTYSARSEVDNPVIAPQAMNTSMISGNSLGFGSYSECLPPSITATLLKSTNCKTKVDSSDMKILSKQSGAIDDKNVQLSDQTSCVVEESDLDVFLKLQLNIDGATPSPRGDYPRNTSQSLRQKMKPFQLSPSTGSDGYPSNSNPAKDGFLNSFSSSKLSDNTSTSSSKQGIATSPVSEKPKVEQDRRLRDGSQSRNSQRSHGSSDGNGTREAKSRTRDSSRKRDHPQLPPPSPQNQRERQNFENTAQYSQILTKSERIRIPVMPEAASNVAGNVLNSTLNRQRSQDGMQPAYYQRVNNYGSEAAIPPPYSALYGNGSSAVFKSLPIGNKEANKSDQSVPNLPTAKVNSNGSTNCANGGGNIVFRNKTVQQKTDEVCTSKEQQKGSSSPTKQLPLGVTVTSSQKILSNDTLARSQDEHHDISPTVLQQHQQQGTRTSSPKRQTSQRSIN